MKWCLNCDSTNTHTDENGIFNNCNRWETCLSCGLGIAATKKGPTEYWLKGDLHGHRIPEGYLLVLKEWPL